MEVKITTQKAIINNKGKGGSVVFCVLSFVVLKIKNVSIISININTSTYQQKCERSTRASSYAEI